MEKAIAEGDVAEGFAMSLSDAAIDAEIVLLQKQLELSKAAVVRQTEYLQKLLDKRLQLNWTPASVENRFSASGRYGNSYVIGRSDKRNARPWWVDINGEQWVSAAGKVKKFPTFDGAKDAVQRELEGDADRFIVPKKRENSPRVHLQEIDKYRSIVHGACGRGRYQSSPGKMTLVLEEVSCVKCRSSRLFYKMEQKK